MTENQEDRTNSSFVAQLRRRKVFRTAVTYGVVAFVVVQLVSAVGAAIGIDEGGVRVILIALVIGFPIVITGAWYLEITNSGVLIDDRFRRFRLSRTAEFVFLGFLFAAAAGIAGVLVWESRTNVLPQRPPSIAVMPFISLGTPNPILSDGLPDQLLARLNSLTEFDVVSRTSSFSDRLKGKDVKEIGAELGTEHVLEGSVQQEGDRVLITAQLIHAQSGRHLWSQTYDRRVGNLLDLEIEIAQSIAKTLKVVLSAGSREAVAAVSTESEPAFEFNLQGWNYFWRPRDEGSLKAAIELFDRASALDPDFQDPIVGRCQAMLSLYRMTLDRTYYEQGTQACLKMTGGFHRSVDVLAALGDFNRAVGNTDDAIDYYTQALAKDHRRPDVYEGLANAYVAQRKFDAADDVFKRALRSEAPPAMVHRGYGYFLSMRGRFEDAAEQFQEALALTPDDGNLLSNLGLTYFLVDRWEDAEGTWGRSLAIKRDLPVLFNVATLYYYQHRYAEARAVLEEALAGRPDNFIVIGKLAAVYRELGDRQRAREYFGKAYAAGTPKGHIEDPRVYGWLASYKANLGEFANAHQLVDQAIRADPTYIDAYYYRALTFALEGRSAEARDAIAHALHLGYSRRMLDADPILGELARMQVAAP